MRIYRSGFTRNDRRDGIQGGAGSFQSFRYSFVRENVHIVHVDPKCDDVARLVKGYRRPRAIHGEEARKSTIIARHHSVDFVPYCRTQAASNLSILHVKG